MFSTLTVVLPIFALIFVGWLARRTGILGPTATTDLNRFVVYLALPALLFDIVAHARWADIWQPGFIVAFGVGSGVVFSITTLVRLRRPRHLADAAIDGLNAAYANTGFIGFPLAVAALGRDTLAPTLIATIMTVCVLFAVAIVLIEIGLQSETSKGALALKVGRSLVKNPLLIAPVLGAFIPLSGATLPAPVETFLTLLGGAASPCALVALGLFLAAKRDTTERDLRSALILVGCKLLVQPAVTWFVAAIVLGLSPMLVQAAVLLSAMPTGTGSFMLAEFYKREAGVTSNVVLASTIVSVFTLSGYLALVH